MTLTSPRHRATAICVHEGKLLVVRLRDSSNAREYLLPPGGLIEEGETPAQAAARETREETGFVVTIDETSLRDVRYSFLWSGREFDCYTSFFKATLHSTTPAPRVPDDVVIGVEWIAVEALEQELAYHPILQKTIVSMSIA